LDEKMAMVIGGAVDIGEAQLLELCQYGVKVIVAKCQFREYKVAEKIKRTIRLRGLDSVLGIGLRNWTLKK
jgi:NAD(P)-dependent dehydrogenase (short-subunit alcohol dehydrogenase family)